MDAFELLVMTVRELQYYKKMSRVREAGPGAYIYSKVGEVPGQDISTLCTVDDHDNIWGIFATIQVFTVVSNHLLEMDVCYLFALTESEQGVAYLLNRLFHDQHFDKI